MVDTYKKTEDLLGLGQIKPSSLLYKKLEPYPTPDTFENLHFITLLGKVKYTDRNIILVETSSFAHLGYTFHEI